MPNAAYLIPAGFKAAEARSNLVAQQSISLCNEYERLDEPEGDTLCQNSRSEPRCSSGVAGILKKRTHSIVCLIKTAVLTDSSISEGKNILPEDLQ